ncbi:MAG: radical SAM protein [Bacteroidales bacterium]|nr:radical SAM protein [Bacteroidales bacterium]
MIKALFYLPWWWFQAKILGRKKPLQTVLFTGDLCNLRCKHCSVYNLKNPRMMSYEEVGEHLRHSYARGSRFVDFEGGEVMIWKDGDYRINDLIDLAKKIGFYSATITTNAQLPFGDCNADSIWVSLDGVGGCHDKVRGEGAFEKLEKNIALSSHKAVSFNMAVNTLNWESMEDTIRYAALNKHIKSISINFHTPFPGTEYLALDKELRNKLIDKVIEYKKAGYPIMNSVSGLKRMKDMNFKRDCWVTDFVYPDGTEDLCLGIKDPSICENCGFCMAGEMYSVFHLKPDTILAGMKLRVI